MKFGEFGIKKRSVRPRRSKFTTARMHTYHRVNSSTTENFHGRFSLAIRLRYVRKSRDTMNLHRNSGRPSRSATSARSLRRISGWNLPVAPAPRDSCAQDTRVTRELRPWIQFLARIRGIMRSSSRKHDSTSSHVSRCFCPFSNVYLRAAAFETTRVEISATRPTGWFSPMANGFRV